MFHKAAKTQAKLRLAISGTSGTGKTYSALAIAKYLGNSIAVIDTEHGSASKYADLFKFDACNLTNFHPEKYIEAIQYASREGYEVLIIDSLSHAWNGKGGALELVDKAAKRTGNKFTAWGEVTPWHNRLIEAILSCQCHVIVTMRSKTEYVMQDYQSNGKTKTRPVKVGMAPIQRDGVEYEFDVVGDLNLDNVLTINKTRCSSLHNAIIEKPGQQLAESLKAWLSDGAEPPDPKLHEAIPSLMEGLGWSVKDARAHLEREYNKRSRSQLNAEELKEFHGYLTKLKEESESPPPASYDTSADMPFVGASSEPKPQPQPDPEAIEQRFEEVKRENLQALSDDMPF